MQITQIKNLTRTFVVAVMMCTSCVKLKKTNQEQSPTAKTWDQDRIEFSTQSQLADFAKSNSSEPVIISAREVVLRNGIILKTEGRDLKIETEHLLIDGHATVQTFAVADKAEIDQPGRSGGKIQIQAATAEGHLDLILNGENGGDGSKGAAPSDELRGTPGKAGQDGQISAKEERGESGYNTVPYCPVSATEGYVGGSGQRGFSGHSGRAGGDTAMLEFKIENREKLVMLVTEKKPGRGGVGGQGGRGGLPGPKGANGALIIDSRIASGVGLANPEVQNIYCPLVKFNQVEPTEGPQGQQGQNGPDGHVINSL